MRSYHDFYWSTPLTFTCLTAIGVSGALVGGFLVGNSLVGGRKRKVFHILFICLGAPFALVGGLLGLAALYLALGLSESGYWGHGPYGFDRYMGDYMPMGLQIIAFGLSIPPGIIGGFLLGLGIQKRTEHNALPR